MVGGASAARAGIGRAKRTGGASGQDIDFAVGFAGGAADAAEPERVGTRGMGGDDALAALRSGTDGGADGDLCAGVSDRRVKALTEEPCGHECSASAFRDINRKPKRSYRVS